MSNVADLLPPPEPFQMAEDVPRDFWVSRWSRWGDPVWRFEPATAGAKDVVLHWDFVIDVGVRLTDPGYEGLLEQARRFFWSMRRASQRGRNPKDTSLRDYFWAMRSLIRWMVKTERRSFSQMTPEASARYLADMAERLERRNNLTFNAVAAYADTLCRIYEQSVLFDKVPDAAISVHPFGGRTAHEVSIEYAPKVHPGFIPAVPDPIYIGSMQRAMECVDIWGEDVVRLTDILLEKRATIDRFRSNSYGYKVNRELSRFRFDGGGTFLTPWRSSLSERDAVTELRQLSNDVRDAGIIVLQGALGLRIGEVCGIVAGNMQGGASWPTCVTVSPSVSGLTELFHLNGRVYKSEEEYDEVAWLVGSRPMGSRYIPPTVRAITVLWRLFRPWRELGEREELIVALNAGHGFPWEKDNIGRALRDSLGKAQRSWVEKYVEIPRQYLGWQLSTHQWRKSFAIYMVRSDARLLPAVRDHFKHMSVAMTEGGYLGRDPEMLGLLDDEATYAAAQFLFDAANGRPAAGKMMETVEENLASILDLIGTEGTEDERVFRLATLFKDDDIRVWPSDWGNCFFLPERARCHYRAKGKFDQSARRPHYGQRRPGVCCDCANLLVFSDDVEFWQARLKGNLAVLEANRAEGEYAAAAVAEDRVRSSAAILKRLGIAVNWTPENEETMEEADEFV